MNADLKMTSAAIMNNRVSKKEAVVKYVNKEKKGFISIFSEYSVRCFFDKLCNKVSG